MIKFILRIMTYPLYRTFLNSISNIEKAQNGVFEKIKAESKSLKRYEGISISNYDDFKSKTDLCEYKDYKELVDKDLAGSCNQSVYGKILFAEKTSGTLSGSKLIPYTQKHLLSYLKMSAVWLADLIKNKSELSTFKLFISISPSFQDEGGMDSDDEYLPWPLRLIFGSRLLIPNGIKQIQDPKLYEEKLLSYLIAQKELELISIWNPSYLLIYLAKLEKDYLHYKKLSKRDDLPDVLNLSAIWPKLKFVSVWGDANSSEDFNRLQSKLPKVFFQKKGLLSTEFPVTIPLCKREQGHYPLAHLIFFELLCDGEIFRLHELELGKAYTLILSAPGGFHRYNTHDVIKVIAFDGGCPIFEFIGRDNNVSDMVGEKLSEVFVKQCILNTSNQSYTYLKACKDQIPYHYQVITDDEELNLAKIEDELCTNVHYNYARKIGQLETLEIKFSDSAEKDYYQSQIESGKKFGDIKKLYLMK